MTETSTATPTEARSAHSMDVYLGTKSTSTDVYLELNRPPQMSTWEPELERENEVRQPELEAPLTKRQLKHRQNKDSKLPKKFVSLDAEISNLKSQMEALEDKITRVSKSTNAGLKRKKIRSMKREADKIAEKLRESEKKLKL